MSELIEISGTPLQALMYKGKRVITFEMIDLAHCRPDRTAYRNFSTNKRHFMRETDYFLLNNHSLHEFRTRNNLDVDDAKHLIVLTITGYLMIVKSLTDDLAWTVQRQLINQYFIATKKPQRLLIGYGNQKIGWFKRVDQRYNDILDEPLSHQEKSKISDYGNELDRVKRRLSVLAERLPSTNYTPEIMPDVVHIEKIKQFLKNKDIAHCYQIHIELYDRSNELNVDDIGNILMMLGWAQIPTRLIGGEINSWVPLHAYNNPTD